MGRRLGEAAVHRVVHSWGKLHPCNSGSIPASAERHEQPAPGAPMPEITDGVEAGDRIVLSDTHEAIPSSTNAQRINGGSNLTGGSSFRGGTRPPG